MSNWKRWPDAMLNEEFARTEHPDRIVYPDLNDGSPLVLACDHSGEHATPEFRVVSFLVTTYESMAEWEPLRLEVRKRHLSDGRRMSFKKLYEPRRIQALPSFLEAASQLKGVLICVGVEKGYSFQKDKLPQLLHSWAPDTLNKLIEVCVVGGVMADGLRSNGQPVHWITDDDSTVANEKARDDAGNVMGGLLHKYPDEFLEIGLSITSQFDDNLRAEDLVAIPDLAAGAYSETLMTLGKSNMPTQTTGLTGKALALRDKSNVINMWRVDRHRPLKHMNAVLRDAGDGKTLVSFGGPVTRTLRPGESVERVHKTDETLLRALKAHAEARGTGPDDAS